MPSQCAVGLTPQGGSRAEHCGGNIDSITGTDATDSKGREFKGRRSYRGGIALCERGKQFETSIV